jgi:hypothetical protein
MQLVSQHGALALQFGDHLPDFRLQRTGNQTQDDLSLLTERSSEGLPVEQEKR